jgi:hypothetical protein
MTKKCQSLKLWQLKKFWLSKLWPTKSFDHRKYGNDQIFFGYNVSKGANYMETNVYV